MKFQETKLKGCYLIDLDKNEDQRGFLNRIFCQKKTQTYTDIGTKKWMIFPLKEACLQCSTATMYTDFFWSIHFLFWNILLALWRPSSCVYMSPIEFALLSTLYWYRIYQLSAELGDAYWSELHHWWWRRIEPCSLVFFAFAFHLPVPHLSAFCFCLCLCCSQGQYVAPPPLCASVPAHLPSVYSLVVLLANIWHSAGFVEPWNQHDIDWCIDQVLEQRSRLARY